MKEALARPTNPLITDRFFYPEHPNLYYHTLSPINALMVAPVTALWGPIAGFNAVAFAWFVLGALGMWWLAYDRARSHAAALLAGIVYAFSPFHMAALIADGQLQIVALHWLPFYVLFLLRTAEQGGRRNILLAGLFLVLTAWTDWYYTLFLLLFTASYAAWRLVARDRTWPARRALTARLVGIGALFALGAAPLLIPMLIEATRTTYMNIYPADDPERLVIDLLAFVLPARLHAWWGAAPWDWGVPIDVNRRFYLGAVALALAVLGAWRSPAARRWGAVALAAGVLALGPTLRVNGDSTGLPLPYRLLANMPLIRLSRQPDRFDVLITLALALMVAYGARALLEMGRRQPRTDTEVATNFTFVRVRPRPSYLALRRPAAILLTIVLAALLAIDYLAAPIITRTPAIPPFLASLPQGDDGALLEYPFHDRSPYRDAERMLFQTVHGRPISGGYHSRRYPQPQLGLPVLRDLAAGRLGGDITTEPGGWPAALRTLGYRYIIGYKQQPLGPRNLEPEAIGAFQALVSAGLGVAQPDYEDGLLIAYRVPDAAPQPVIGFREGWGAPEQSAGRPERWLEQAGSLSLAVPAAGRYRLSWSALPAAGPRTLEIRQGDRLFALPLAAQPRRYQLLLDLPAGLSRLELRSREPATSGDALEHNGDMRLISVRFASMALELVRQ
ncbi:MAG TPA: 6-pyruvoyl-tetrahydropterin synthase-related protein [Roseiflexaceae bacterium]|nr:6-pyruvoyl-tetrahydropterin synthase-related protein [Roseiflexaceae bacterium]